jgi:lipoprotein NlpI
VPNLRKDQNGPEIITPLSVTPRASGKGLPLAERNNRNKAALLVLALVLLVGGGLWLLDYLADRPAEKAPAQMPADKPDQPLPNHTARQPLESAQSVADPATVAAEKEQAEKSLAEFMTLKQELEAKGVSQWGDETYRQMTRLADEADRFLLENDYAAAAAGYFAAVAKARILIGQIGSVLERLLAEGQAAMDQGSAELAQQKFSIALMIDPDNRIAGHSLKRAQKIDTVRQLLESGIRHENAGKIAFAHADYQEALRLDPESKEARQALGRIKGQIRQEEFQQLMSEGLTALHRNDYQLAREKLLKAKSFRPQSQEVQDALAQVDQSIRLARIETYRQQAAAAEKAENWTQALDAYGQVLEIDANIQFAARGKNRALDRIRIDRRIDFFLQQPSALESDRQLDNALALIAEIEEINPKGAQLKDRFEKLARIVEAAQTPVKLVIESDTFTDVVVYKIGKLGRFASRELSLRPGTYTVVGTRDGYQDVRQNIIIKPGQDLVRIAIRCEIGI